MQTELRDVAAGLWVWRVEHPAWRPDFDWEPLVASTYVESGGERLVLDPLAPPADASDVAAGKVAAGLDRLQLGLRDIVAPEEARAERAGAVAAHEQVDVADVIGLENDDDRRRALVEPLPL